MKPQISAFVAGLIFALGLAVGGMTNPDVVLSFLDVSGHWNPSLAFVMAGAIAVYAPFAHKLKRRSRPHLGEMFHWPARGDIDTPLIVGAILFGAGWGLGGFCPGPALVSAMSLGSSALIFVASMLAGMWGFSVYQARRGARSI